MPHQFQTQMNNNQSSNENEDEHRISNDNESTNLDTSSSNPIISTATNNTNNANTSSNSNNSDICRDYLRNSCRRGNSCKFNHPEITNDGKRNDISMLTFCHDYQNRECRRSNCKFIHCSKQEEEVYKQTGKLPANVNLNNQSSNFQNNNANKFGINKKMYNNNNYDVDVPVCKDFIKGDCFRGSRCKFKHVLKNDLQDRNYLKPNNYETSFDNFKFQNSVNCDKFSMMQRYDQLNQIKKNSLQNHISPLNRDNSFSIPNSLSLDRRNNGMRMFEPEAKRRAFDSGYNTPTTFTFANNSNLCVTSALNHHNQIHQPNGTSTANTDTNSTTAATAAVAAAAAAAAINEFNGSNVSTAATANTISRSMYSNMSDNQYLFEENTALRRRIENLKEQVGDLVTANEFLLKQNAQLRNLANVTPTTTVGQKQLSNSLHTVATTLHNAVSVLHSSAVQKQSSNQGASNSQPPPIPIGPPTIATTDLLVANHLHRQQQQQQQTQQQQRAAAAAVAVVAAAAAAATSGAVSSMSGATVPPSVSGSGLPTSSSISALTTSTSTPLVSYPIMTATIPHSLGHLTH